MKFKDSVWEYDDFKFKDNTLLGFSEQGKIKAKNNHSLFLPEKTDNGVLITKIGRMSFKECGINELFFDEDNGIEVIEDKAFRLNSLEFVDFNILKSLIKIEPEAFQLNKLKSIYIHDLDNLKEIGYDAFSNNKYSEIKLENLKRLSHMAKGAFTSNVKAKVELINLPELEKIEKDIFYRELITEFKIINCPNLRMSLSALQCLFGKSLKKLEMDKKIII